MARIAARWKRYNLMKLVTLKKGNHQGESYVRRGRRKVLYRRERNSLEGTHEEAEIQPKAVIPNRDSTDHHQGFREKL